MASVSSLHDTYFFHKSTVEIYAPKLWAAWSQPYKPIISSFTLKLAYAIMHGGSIPNPTYKMEVSETYKFACEYDFKLMQTILLRGVFD